MERKPSRSQFGRAYALLIGNSDYSNRNGFKNLGAPGKDVDAVYIFLKKKCSIKFDDIK